MAKIKDYVSQVEKSVREGWTVQCEYELDTYRQKLDAVSSHWQH